MKFVENEVTFVMWFMYEYTENEITELNQSYGTRLSEEEKKKIFIPIYDCMKKYQGSWHIEEKTVFPEYFLIKESQRETLRNAFAETEMIWQICCTGCNALIFLQRISQQMP